MLKMLLSLLLVLSMGWADGKNDRSVVKKKVVKIAFDDNQESKNINVEADIDGETLKLVITVNGDVNEFEVSLDNEEAMESLERELDEMDLDINISQFLGHGNRHDDDHDFRRMIHWRGNETGGGYLGVQIQGLDGPLADYFGAKNGGVLVTEVIEDSPAEKSGMKAGDVIISVAGEDVENPSELVEEIRGHNLDSKVELNIIRKNRKRKMKVTLGEAPQTFGMGYGPGQNQMFFGDGHGFNDEDVDIFFNMDHGNPHKMMKKFRFHDEDDEKKTEYHSHSLDSVPYSESVQVGGMLYISGQIGNKENNYNEIVPGGIRPQVNQAMKNINAILKKHSATMDDIVKCTCILADVDDWGAMSEEYVKYFKNHKPARTTFGGADLPIEALVEIDCIANLK